jgi:tripeptide aminopeptidase
VNQNTLAVFLRNEALSRFLRYVQVDTGSDDASGTCPSTPGQLELGRMLAGELASLGLEAVSLDNHGYLYATVPASPGATGPAITFCAHFDTSPSENGRGVTPRLIEHYDGGEIRFPDADDLLLSPDSSPELSQFVGETIITASGTTLLGADDKAGLAEIMAAVAAICTFPDLPHPELRLVFTPDEEIGRGADRIDMARLGTVGYTVDGGLMGELESECFDAREAVIDFTGRNIHPGYAKGRMINAGAIAARFVAALPEYETPEHTENREGFWHLTAFSGDENRARARMILRDFERAKNDGRITLLEQMVRTFTIRYPGLGIELKTKDQYRNMGDVLAAHPEVVRMAETAMVGAGVRVIRKPIRGGTDGARLSFMGMPCPNLFAGGLMFHSKTEWVPVKALEKSTETILHLCRLWTGRH